MIFLDYFIIQYDIKTICPKIFLPTIETEVLSEKKSAIDK